MFKPSNPTVYLKSITLNKYTCFGENTVFNFAFIENKNKYHVSKCTIILGNNGTGKTNILKAISNVSPSKTPVDKDSENLKKNNSYGDDNIPDYSIELNVNGSQQEENDIKYVYRPKVYERLTSHAYSVNSDFVVYNGEKEKKINQIYHILAKKINDILIKGQKHIAISHASIGYTNVTNSIVKDIYELDNYKVYAYGANRFAASNRNVNSTSLSDTLFDVTSPLINLEEWLLQLNIAANNKSSKNKAEKRILQLKSILKKSSLFPDIENFYVYTDEELNSYIKFNTSDGDFRLNELGYGYQSMFSWIFDFCKKMFDRYPDSDNPLEEPAVLLIDEIDSHLHPIWQRSVVKDISELFINTQLILTTHSPLVIQSLEDINLYILSKGEEGTIVEHYPNASFQGWSVEEIMSELMELKDGVRSDMYNRLVNKFKQSLLNHNSKKSREIYNQLKSILHPNSIDKEIFEMQIEGIDDND